MPDNALAGWDIYKASDYEATLVEINDELLLRGLPPVSLRMYTHYRKMRRYGYEQYIAINQLDVRTMEDPIWDRALRGRYPMYEVEEVVRVLLLVEDEPTALPGLVEEVSDGELLLRINGEQAVSAFTAKGGVWAMDVIFAATGEVRLCEVSKVTVDRRLQRVTVRAHFIGPTSARDVLVRQSLAIGSFDVTVGSDPETPLLVGQLSRSSGYFRRPRRYALPPPNSPVRLKAARTFQCRPIGSRDFRWRALLRRSSPLLARSASPWASSSRRPSPLGRLGGRGRRRSTMPALPRKR